MVYIFYFIFHPNSIAEINTRTQLNKARWVLPVLMFSMILYRILYSHINNTVGTKLQGLVVP